MFTHDKLTIPNPSFDKAKYLQKIEEIVEGRHDNLNDSEPANYDAINLDNPEYMPILLNIWNHQPKSGLGYLVFHDFLNRVGQGNDFNCSNLTKGDGQKMFEKAVKDGLIINTLPFGGRFNDSGWKVISDPIEHLKQLANSTKQS